MKRWVLFVDESGDIPCDWSQAPFHPDECNVSGVLVEEDFILHRETKIDTTMRSIFPWATWPFHQTELRRPIVHLVWVERWLHGESEEARVASNSSWGVRALALARSVREEEPDAYAWLERFLQSGGDWSRTSGNALRTAAESDSAAWTAFLDDVESRQLRLDDAVEKLLGDRKLMVFSCGEAERGDCIADENADPWGTLFVGLLVRVIDDLMSQPGEHHLEVRCANRWVWHERMQVATMMTGVSLAEYIRDALGEGATGSCVRSADASVHVAAGKPLEYGAEAGAFLIIADRLANGMRHWVRHSSTLRQVSSQFRRAMSFAQPLYERDDEELSLPRLAAIGCPARYVELQRGSADPDRDALAACDAAPSSP